MSATTQEIVAAADVLVRAGLTAAQVVQLIQAPPLEREAVLAQFDRTDDAIQQAREND